MTYFVTFCALDQKAGANPLWHSCLLLSQLDAEQKKMKVVATWGFYGVPTTGSKSGLMHKLKTKLGVAVDLAGNHGMFRHEDIRFLDLGKGLHGVTFELTPAQFALLQQKCLTMAAEQEQAINEVVLPLGLQGKPKNEAKMYPHEQYSALIYDLEKIKAQEKGEKPRLQPFEIRASLGLWGPGLQYSDTCKSLAISLLAQVLTEKQIARLTENGNHPSLPRYSGKMEDIYLHSTGPICQYTKTSGDVVCYRDGTDPEVKLYWTLPPQELETSSKDTTQLLQLDKEYCQEMKSIVNKLQGLEWLFRNACLPSKLQSKQQSLIQQIVSAYQGFSVIKANEPMATSAGWHGFTQRLFAMPRNKEERDVQEKIKQAKSLFNSLYMAVVDKWELIDSDSDAVEVVASSLSINQQKTLCEILGRTYCEAEPTLEDAVQSAALS
ncbi:MAG: hypothetical protein ACHP65_04255 [Legionellales bacterium]